jgi:hypothetical protein
MGSQYLASILYRPVCPRGSASRPAVERFAVCGWMRGVWLWLCDQGLRFPLQPAGSLDGSDSSRLVWGEADGEIRWRPDEAVVGVIAAIRVEPTYHAVHTVLTHPAYAGAYTFGRHLPRTLRRRRRPPAGAPPQAAPRPVGGAYHRPSRWLRRLGHLGQPGPHPWQ